jgi:hypothetical protein
MHTIVIHLYENLDEWHLIEPLFYKVQHQMELSFFYEKNVGEVIDYKKLFIQISETLQYRDINEWQLLVIMHIPQYEKSYGRLSTYLHDFKSELITPLKENGHEAQNEIILLIDSLSKNNDFSPREDSITNTWWQIDNFGYLKNSSFDHNKLAVPHVFTNEEINMIDFEWGSKINLHEAGVINAPQRSFLEELHRRVTRVERLFDKMIEQKLKEVETKLPPFQNDLVTTHELNEISSSFSKQLLQAIRPPLSEGLANFKPSNILKDILQNTLSLNWYKKNFLVFRLEVSSKSLKHRIEDLMNMALLVNVFVSKPELLSRFSRGSFHDIYLKVDKKNVQEMLIQYETCLNIAEQSLQNKLLERQHIFIQKFDEIKAFPHTISSLENSAIEEPNAILSKKSPITFLYDWEHYITKVNENLKSREAEIHQRVKEGIRKLSIQKRESLLSFSEAQAEITDYISKVENQISKTILELDTISPQRKSPIDTWKSYSTSTIDKLKLYLKQLPSSSSWWFSYLAISLIIIVPFLTSFHNQLTTGNTTTIITYGSFLIFLLTITLVIVVVTDRSIQRPIVELISTTKNTKNECVQYQQKMLYSYNEYLNKVYLLFTIRRQYRHLQDSFKKIKEENVAYRYHQTKIEEHKRINNRLMALVSQRQSGDRRRCEAFFEQKFKLDGSILDNPIYSPLEFQFNAARGDQSLKLNIGNSVDSITNFNVNPLTEIQFSIDKVYRL